MTRDRDGARETRNYFANQSVSERYAHGRPYFHPEVISRIRERLKLDQHVDYALDVGCGTGQSTVALRQLAQHVDGADASPEMLAHAQREDGIEYVTAPAERMPFSNETFDLITVASAFHWFNRSLFLDEAFRLLRPSSWLVVYDNAFHGIMHENPQFNQWARSEYVGRCPSPRRDRRPLTSVEADAHGFRFHGHEEYTNIVSFSPEELVSYLMTQSNIIVAIEEDKTRAEDVLDWLLAATSPMFQGTQGSFQFGGSINYLQKH